MSMFQERSATGAVDEQLRDFVEVQSKKQEFQVLIHALTDICWETCIDKPSPRLESKVEKCIGNCVERFIDTTNYITNRLGRVVLNSPLEINAD